MSAEGWKTELRDQLPEELAREIDIFETQLELRRLGKVDEKVFAETRLRRGAYGQRYDNGQRHDGIASRTLPYPSAGLLKGPDTLWDAPGMQRIKIPHGTARADQLELLADIAEEYADGICHITTRQDIQLHYVHIDDSPTLMRRLAAVGITTREACGNAIRNVTACPNAGTCADEPFDVTPYAQALAQYLLGHPGTQDFGRKFKISFGGCAQHACGLATIHDLAFVAQTRQAADGTTERGFSAVVGGGLGAVPFAAQPLDPFVPEEELFPLSLAVCRLFARLGEKRNRARARLKFVVQKLGMDGFRQQLATERAALEPDPRWRGYLDDIAAAASRRDASAVGDADTPALPTSGPLASWLKSNTEAQPQAGYRRVTVTCPLGDLSAMQMRGLADLARRYGAGDVRFTLDQNVMLRWVELGQLASLYQDLCTLGLGGPGAGRIADLVACPGTDTCKLGIASSRGLAAELAARLSARQLADDPVLGGLHVKVSGCFNACAQHHLADIGFWGINRKVGSHAVPHFQAVIGGQWSENGGSYGVAVAPIPSRNVPAALDRLLDHFKSESKEAESFQDFAKRLGKAKIRAVLQDLTVVPPYEVDPTFYSDWGDPREFSIGDMGIGECAGEVISPIQFGLAASERAIYEAQEHLDRGDAAAAEARALGAMLTAARSITLPFDPQLGEAPEQILPAFRSHLYDTQRFHDPYAGGKFASYLFRASDEAADEETSGAGDGNRARQRIEEAQLFVEASHSCYGRLVQQGLAT